MEPKLKRQEPCQRLGRCRLRLRMNLRLGRCRLRLRHLVEKVVVGVVVGGVDFRRRQLNVLPTRRSSWDCMIPNSMHCHQCDNLDQDDR